jgi:hypothetical protein
MADRALDYEDFFGNQAVISRHSHGAANGHMEISANVLESIFQFLELLERSPGSEAAVRLATVGLKRALGNVVCVPEAERLS